LNRPDLSGAGLQSPIQGKGELGKTLVVPKGV
jgi:hypothetical protein